MHVKVSVYRESFFFFHRTTQCRSKTSCRPGHRQSPLSFPQPRYIPHERFLVVENLGQPRASLSIQAFCSLYSRELGCWPKETQGIFRHPLDLEWFPFVNRDRFHGNHRLSWRMMWKICKPLFHLTFQRICDCIECIGIGKWFVKLKTWRRRFPRLCKWESIPNVISYVWIF